MSRAVRTVALVPNRERPVAREIAHRAASRLLDAGVEIRLLPDDAAATGLDAYASKEDAIGVGLDVAISLGGDGTMLRTVALVHEHGAAVLGVNVGHLGYLTVVEPAELDRALDRLVSGDYQIETRTTLQVEVERSSGTERRFALNEMVIEKIRAGRLVRLGVHLNGTPFTTYFADGVIVATPTGSTAYSFSARGPIVSPRLACLVLTPVSPHMLFDRSLVLGPNEEIRFEVLDGPPTALTLDGQEQGELIPGDVAVVMADDQTARMVTFAPRDFHQLLRDKFHLADR